MEELFLTEEQKNNIIEKWNSLNEPPSIKALVQFVFGDGFDERSKQAKVIKEFLANRNLVPRYGKPEQYKKEKIVLLPLTEEQKIYVTNNIPTMTSLEITKELFKNPKLTSLHAETRLVYEFVKTLNIKDSFDPKADKDIPLKDYNPPSNFEQAFKKVNKCINHQLDKDKLTPKQKKDLNMLINYLHTHRLLKQINNYASEEDRESFEDAFIRYTYDKSDLTQEEIDQYISLSHEVVTSFHTQKRIEELQKILSNTTSSQAGDDYVKISMSLNEAIGNAQDEYNQCVKRQHSFLDDLKEKRSKRMSKEISENASVLNLLNLWREEESRKMLLKWATKEQEAMSKELTEMEQREELKLKILGLTREEVLYGTL